MRNLLISFVLIILCSSCSSKYEGNTLEARNNRREGAHTLLETSKPNGCSYQEKLGTYTCLDGETEDKINSRVITTRKQLESYLKGDPYLKNGIDFVKVVLDNLYYCKDQNKLLFSDTSNYLRCESPLPDLFLKDGANYIGRDEDFYEYELR